ncbi:hypothetical protein QZH41_017067, partial [Actinostola sp. cb2023]
FNQGTWYADRHDKYVELDRLLPCEFFSGYYYLGYFIHDLFDMLFNDLKKSGALILHHIMVLGAFSLAVFQESYLGFVMGSLVVEINSVFLHSRRIMVLHNVSKASLKYEVNGVLLIFTFVVFRFFTNGWMVYFTIHTVYVLPLMVSVYVCIAAGIVTIINIILFMIIWNADFKKRFQMKDE